jgi:hypothetical protein
MLFTVLRRAFGVRRRSVTGSVGATGRAAGWPGGGIGARGAPEGATPRFEARASLAKSPDDHDTRLSSRHCCCRRPDGRLERDAVVLERASPHTRALTYQSLVRLNDGPGDWRPM